MKNLRLVPDLYRQYPFVKATLVFDALWRYPLKPQKRIEFYLLRHLLNLVEYKYPKTTAQDTHVFKRILERVRSFIDRLIIDRNLDNQHNRNKVNSKNIENLSEPGSDIH